MKVIPENVRYVIEKLNKNGFEAYAVGGCVRDRLLGKEPDDWDITTSALPEETAEIFSEHHLNLKGLKHGTVGVIRNGAMTEITTYRIDGDYVDSRHPESVIFTPSLYEDLARRDFTVNAMAMDIEERITDLFNGRDDLERRIIRSVGDAYVRFNEDALRIMRGARFASHEGFSLEKGTLDAMNALAPKLKGIARERIYTELKKMLALKNAPRVMEVTLPVFLSIFPTLDESKWHKICEDSRKAAQDGELILAIILLNADTQAELERLKTETRIKRKVLAIKELLLSPIEDDRAFLQRLMCDHGVENVLFAAKYLTVTKGTAHFAQALLASEGIVDVKGLNISGEDVKALGYKSYLIKQALRDALDAVITNRCENTHDALCAYLRSRLKP